MIAAELLTRVCRLPGGPGGVLVWTRFRRGSRWHANARMLVPRPDGTVGWAQVITSDARTRLGSELHVIRGRLAVRWALTRITR